MGKGKDRDELCACCAMCGAAAFCCIAVLILMGLIGLGIAKIVVGAMYFHKCDIEKMIPIFLIVSAVAPMLFGGLGKRNEDDSLGFGTICGVIGFLFNLAWLIAGSVWVYGTWALIHSDTYVPCSKVNRTEGCTPGTCHNTLLTFSFAIVTIDWVFTGLWIVVIGCMILRACAK